MKIEVNEDNEIVFSDVFNAIGVRTTEDGEFGICQRDGGLEIVQDGKIVWDSMDAKDLSKDHERISEWMKENVPSDNIKEGELVSEIAIRIMGYYIDSIR